MNTEAPSPQADASWSPESESWFRAHLAMATVWDEKTWNRALGRFELELDTSKAAEDGR
ncbi:hypothetical protein [Isoptericola sp. NPDC057191]|uniref:hypothetical protein n=1 Tax=Isoptericola sp. NPDC057191 TaxID=3346041 RepID=UPI003628122A